MDIQRLIGRFDVSVLIDVSSNPTPSPTQRNKRRSRTVTRFLISRPWRTAGGRCVLIIVERLMLMLMLDACPLKNSTTYRQLKTHHTRPCGQTESVSKRNASLFDDVAESYQAPATGHEIYVQVRLGGMGAIGCWFDVFSPESQPHHQHRTLHVHIARCALRHACGPIANPAAGVWDA